MLKSSDLGKVNLSTAINETNKTRNTSRGCTTNSRNDFLRIASVFLPTNLYNSVAKYLDTKRLQNSANKIEAITAK